MKTKPIGLVLLIVGIGWFSTHLGWAESERPPYHDEGVKEVATTLPSGASVTMTAFQIDRNWETLMTHLKGNVEVRFQQSSKADGHFFVVRADEVDFNEKTGEVIPMGNVRVTQEVR